MRGRDIISSLATTRTTSSDLDDGGAADALEKANGAFTALAKKPKFLDQLKNAYAAGDAVYKATKKLEQDATKTTTPSTPAPSGGTTTPAAPHPQAGAA